MERRVDDELRAQRSRSAEEVARPQALLQAQTAAAPAFHQPNRSDHRVAASAS